MAHKGATSPARPPAVRGSSYRASLSMLAFLVACLTALLLITLDFSSLNPLLQTLRRTPEALSLNGIARAGPVIAAPVLAGVLAYLIGQRLIHLLRIETYRRHLHGYLNQWLLTYAPLACIGFRPDMVRIPSGESATPAQRINLADCIQSHKLIVLLGPTGSGKTVALHELAYELTRKRVLASLWLGAAPLPVLLTLGPLASGEYEDDAFQDRIQASLRLFGTRGLAASAHGLLRRGRLVVLCDGLDAVPLAHRARVLRRIADSSHLGRPLSVVAAWPSVSATEAADNIIPQAGWEQVQLKPLHDAQISAVLRKSRSDWDSHKDVVPPLLLPALGSPSVLSALVRMPDTRDGLPATQAELLRRFTQQAFALPPTSSVDNPDRSLTLVSAIAAGLRAVRQHSILTIPAGSLGRTVTEWLEHAELPMLVSATSDELAVLRPEEMEAACRQAKLAGVLAQDASSRELRFANGTFEAAFAARWLDVTDTGLDRLQPELAQNEWLQPALLWASAADHPGDIAARLLRLLDAPGESVASAGFVAEHEFQAAVLALALGVSSSGLASCVEGGSVACEPSERSIALCEAQLRDVLDLLFSFMEDPERQSALQSALTTLVAAVGVDVLTALRFLATHTSITALVRAQVVVTLGLIRTAEATDTVIALLDDPSALMRQAVERALTLAGASAIPALHLALGHSSERVRLRASEALAQLGGNTALDVAITGLAGKLPEQRAAAAWALGTLRSERAEAALIERLSQDAVEQVRIAVALALGQVASEAAVLALEQAASSDDSALVRAAIAQALGETRQPDALKALLRLLADAEPRVRAAAASGLGVLGDVRAVPALEERRDDRDLWTQNAVVVSLRRLGV